MHIRILSPVLSEIAEIAMRLLPESPAAAKRFFEDFDRVKSLIQAHPHIGKLCDDGSRRFSFRDFPYDVFYEVGPGEIVITDIDHHHRDRKVGETGTAQRRQKDAHVDVLEQELLALPLDLRILLAEWLAVRTEE
ncbi:MAG TPA: type II toxin-antitoxin system RelE/ParE family toxin [Longimicrobium sp.]|nr:type II toxin-antitoxin system RelE/ParE family toxin [Longimicrobium sp.]